MVVNHQGKQKGNSTAMAAYKTTEVTQSQVSALFVQSKGKALFLQVLAHSSYSHSGARSIRLGWIPDAQRL